MKGEYIETRINIGQPTDDHYFRGDRLRPG